MPDMIPITKPLLDEREAEAARRAILSGWVTQGPEVAAFEQEFAAYVGTPYACALSSCTTALHLALLAAGVGEGDEVITVSHSFIATANSVRYCGAIPVFVDIDPQTFNIDPEQIEQAITPKTRAILCVDQIGMPCDLSRIVEIGRKHRVPVVEDAACAIGSHIRWEGKWEKLGKPHADIACFSFHPRKLLTTGDGGMLTTANADWDAGFRLRRQHAMSVPDTVRHKSSQVVFESYEEVGFNYRMTDIQAAIGREQLKRIPELVERRRNMAKRYRELLSDLDGIIPPHEPEWARSNWQSYCVRLPKGLDQLAVMQQMLEAGVSTRRGVMCAHREHPYRDGRVSRIASSLRHSEEAQDHCILLPLFHQLTEEQQDRVVTSLKSAIAARAVAR